MALDRVIWGINYGLLGIVLFSAICLLIVFIQVLCCEGWHIALSTNGIKNMQIFWQDYLPLIKLLGCSLTIWIASYNLSRYLSVETVNALGRLREMLNSEEKKKIHTFLFDKEDAKPILPELQSAQPTLNMDFSQAELFDYLGTIELGAIMVRRGLISVDEFYNQFGYRVENISENTEIQKYLNNTQKYHSDLLYISEQIKKQGQKLQ